MAGAADCGDRGYSFEFPSSRQQGQAAFDKNIPSYGRLKDSDDAKAHPEEHIGRRRAQPPALGNDTYGTCNPMGMPRAILYPDPVEFIVLTGSHLSSTSSGATDSARSGWTAARFSTPDDVDICRGGGVTPPDDGRATRWSSNRPGYDERTWVDYFGYPHSDQMVLPRSVHAHQLRHARAEDDAHRSEVLRASRG